MIKEYQDPKNADKILKLQGDLDDMKGMLTKTMDQVRFFLIFFLACRKRKKFG